MTPELKKECHRLLKKAKKRLSHERSEKGANYLCWAILPSTKKISVEADGFLLKLINERLNGCTFYTAWLIKTHPELRAAVEKDKDYNNRRQAQLSRHAWLDSLIAEFA